MRIFADQNIPFAKTLFSFAGDVTLFDGRSLNNNDLAQCDVLLIRSVTKVNEDLLKDTPVKWVGTATAGTNHIDMKYLKKQGILFHSAPGSNAQSVAEYVLSALLHLEKKNLFDFSDKVGIVGYGEVGSRLAKLLDLLQIPWIAVDPPRKEQTGESFLQPYSALKDCKHISFHIPLTKHQEHSTLNLIDTNFLQSLTQCKTIINSCRGEIVVEEDMLHFMQTNDFTLITDVFWNEPLPSEDYRKQSLWNTPHVAGYATQAKINGSLMLQKSLAIDFNLTYESAKELMTEKTIDLRETDPKDWLFEAVQKCYDLQTDHKLFEKHTPKNQIFDQLRKEYPLRHQFENCNLILPSNEKEHLLEKLGFQIKKD